MAEAGREGPGPPGALARRRWRGLCPVNKDGDSVSGSQNSQLVQDMGRLILDDEAGAAAALPAREPTASTPAGVDAEIVAQL